MISGYPMAVWRGERRGVSGEPVAAFARRMASRDFGAKEW